MASGTGKKASGVKLEQALQEGLAHQRAGRVSKALQLYKKILKIMPNQPDTLHLVGLCHHQQKNDRKAVEMIGKSLSILPDNPVAHNNIGVSLCSIGQDEQAEEHYREAIKLQPSYAEAHKNLASLLCNRQAFDEAISHYQIAIKNSPQHFKARTELARALVTLGRPTEALKQYEVALKLNPRDADLQTDMAIALKGLGKTDEAIPHHYRAMKLDKSENRHLFAFANSISGHKVLGRSDELDQTLLTLLDCRQINPAGILQPTLSSLMLQEDFSVIIERLSSVDASATPVNNDEIRTLTSKALFLKVLEMLPLANTQFELALTHIRQNLLLDQKTHYSDNIPFAAALASQCFNNEYVYFVTPEEKQALANIEDEIRTSVDSSVAIDPLKLILLASYKPLFEYRFGPSLTERPLPTELAIIIQRQIHEPAEELELRHTIPDITPIEDTVSQEVRAQYEDNPYPRWMHTGLAREGRKIDDLLRANPLNFDLGDYEAPNKPEILVAGCGTGQHSLQTATRFKNVKVLAVDLSLTSLAYAQRKTKELGVRNIEFGHADILELGNLGRQFDVIESSGVLHHLHEPMAGWRVLNGILRPGGLMKIGLYSEIARQDIVKAREYISQKGYSGSRDDIRTCRHDILTEDNNLLPQLGSRGDFYSLSACRDLIFHIQEHRFTLPQIESALNELGLEFIDFEIQAPHLFRTKQAEINKTKGNKRLKLWHQYETEFPSTFSNMYQFWCRKPKTA